MKPPRSFHVRSKRRSLFRLLFTFMLTTIMIATAGFGAFPDNPLTDLFQAVLVENFPPEFLSPLNAYLKQMASPQIAPRPDSVSESGSSPDPVGVILSWFDSDASVTASEVNFMTSTVAAIQETQTQVASIQTQTATAARTQTAVPTLALTASVTPAATLTPTFTAVPPVVVYRPQNTAIPAADTPTPGPTHLLLYSTYVSLGNLYTRNDANGSCDQSWGYSAYLAFIGYSNLDSINNMPSNYGIPTNLPVKSLSNVVLANDWADLMDGTLDVSLNTAGVTSSSWWSGADDGFGNFVDGVTPGCNGWSDDTIAFTGKIGRHNQTGTGWMDFGVRDCSDYAAVLCIAY